MPKLDAPPEQFTPDWLSQLDGRRGVSQAMRQRYRQFTDDLGGESTLSYAQLSLVSRALFLEYWLQQQEQTLAAGNEVDMGKYTQSINALQGILQKLGLERKAKEHPSLGEYLKAKGGNQ